MAGKGRELAETVTRFAKVQERLYSFKDGKIKKKRG